MKNSFFTYIKSYSWIYPVLLITSVFVFYFPMLGNDFQYSWDDQWQVMNEFTEGGITVSNLKLIFTSIFHGQYFPVCQVLYLFLYNLVGYNPFYFHLICMLLHAFCVYFVFILIIRLYRQTKRTHNLINDNNITIIALITALIFAIHPLNVESVAWISAIKILIYAFFYLLATMTFLSYLKKGNILYYILTILLFALSLGGKEQAVTFPVWLLLVYYILGYDLKSKKNWIQTAPFFLLSVFFGLIVIKIAGRNDYTATDLYPLWQRLVFACYSLVEYITKFVFPYKLLYIYPFPMASGERLPDWLLVYPALILIIVVALQKQLLKKPYIFGVLFFLLHIAICLHIVPLSRFAIVADRYMYLPCIGFAFIVAYCFVMVKEQLNLPRNIQDKIFIMTSFLKERDVKMWISSRKYKYPVYNNPSFGMNDYGAKNQLTLFLVNESGVPTNFFIMKRDFLEVSDNYFKYVIYNFEKENVDSINDEAVSTEEKPEIKVVNKHDFGDINLNEKAFTYFEFENLSSVHFIITEVKSNCGCTVSEWDHKPAKRGEILKVKVEYDAKEAGLFSKRITVFSNAKDSPHNLTITGNVKQKN